MNNSNNKGQSLVLFIFIIPIILIILLSIIDIGNLIIEKNEIDNINYLTVDYALEHLEEKELDTKIKNMINKNDSEIIITEIIVKDKEVFIKTEKKVNSIFINNLKLASVKSNYYGHIENNKIKIERK